MIKKIILFFSFLILTLIYIYSFENLTVIQKGLSNQSFSNSNYGELLKGEKIQGSFTATDNFLGQMLIRFYNFQRINPDSVIFRIKEQGVGNWYYESTSKTDQFQPNLLFPFGFVPVPDSKGKKYDFEVESLDGLSEHSIGLSVTKPLGAVAYQYPRSYLLKNHNILLGFIFNKIQNVNLSLDFLKELGIYLTFITLSLLLIDLGLKKITEMNFGLIKNNLSTFIILAGILFLVLSALFLYIKKENLSFDLTVVAYFILLTGIVFSFIQGKIKKDNSN